MILGIGIDLVQLVDIFTGGVEHYKALILNVKNTITDLYEVVGCIHYTDEDMVLDYNEYCE